jgi:hypothetical protein
MVGKIVGGLRNLILGTIAFAVGLLVLIVAVGILGSIGRRFASNDDGVTVYPVIACSKPCGDFARNGKEVKRNRVPLEKETFRAFPERQDVIRQSRTGIQSLTRDLKFTCTVLAAKTWECKHEIAEDRSESYKMEDGYLEYAEMPFDEARHRNFVPWCMWQQNWWHNETTNEDDAPGKSIGFVWGLVELAVAYTTGCWL